MISGIFERFLAWSGMNKVPSESGMRLPRRSIFATRLCARMLSTIGDGFFFAGTALVCATAAASNPKTATSWRVMIRIAPSSYSFPGLLNRIGPFWEESGQFPLHVGSRRIWLECQYDPSELFDLLFLLCHIGPNYDGIDVLVLL